MTPATFQGYFEQPDTPAAGSPVGIMMLRILAKNSGMSFEQARQEAHRLPSSGSGRNDRHDIDRRELKLLTVGHYLWAIYKKECGKSGNVSGRQALWEALQQVWERKRELRKELRAERQAKAALLRERFAPQSGHWSVRDLLDRLEQCGARVEVESKLRNLPDEQGGAQ